MEEKRKFKRLNNNFFVEYKIKIHQGHNKSSMKNISTGGICLLTKQNIKVGTIIDIKFTIPDSLNEINVNGIIVWNDIFIIDNEEYYDNGIKFIAISNKDRELIEKYIKNATFLSKL